jgi:flagellar biosynthesis protein
MSAAESETIPVIRNAILADNLTNIELGEEIPEELFESVAIVLSWAYWLKGKEP